MFIDARQIPSGSVIDCGLCIVGAGAAGITLAHRLRDSGIDLCLLESGGLALDWETQSLGQGANLGQAYSDLDSCQLRYFGGNTNAWGGWVRPLDEIDFERRSWVPQSGWPFAQSELAPYYDAVHRLCEVEDTGYDVRAAIDKLGSRDAQLIPFDDAKLETVLYRFSPPTRFGQTYREALRSAGNVRCLTNATVLAIKASADATRVERLSVGCLSGGGFAVTAKIFILAAGAIENARLLLLSNDVAANGLGNTHDNVGRYFMDHPHPKRTLLARRCTIPLGLYGLSFRDRGVAVGLSLPRAVQAKEELLNYKASIYPVYAGQASRGWYSFRNLVLSLSPHWRSDPYDRFSLPFARKGISARQIWDIARQFDKVTIAAFAQLLKPDRLVSRFILESKPEQAPNRDSRVTLSRDRDALGRNRVSVDWRLSANDVRTVARAEEIVDGELRRLGIGELAPCEERPEERAATFVGGWHQIGTTRAHEDPKQGVVDADCRVHGITNLFIAGASVFPTGGAVSPTPTILALTLRLADRIERLLR